MQTQECARVRRDGGASGVVSAESVLCHQGDAVLWEGCAPWGRVSSFKCCGVYVCGRAAGQPGKPAGQKQSTRAVIQGPVHLLPLAGRARTSHSACCVATATATHAKRAKLMRVWSSARTRCPQWRTCMHVHAHHCTLKTVCQGL